MILYNPPSMPGVRWRMLIDAIFEVPKMSYKRITKESGMEQCVLDEIIGGKAPNKPNKTEKHQLMLIASKYVAVSELRRCGFSNEEIDEMCFLSEDRGMVERRVVEDPIRVFS